MVILISTCPMTARASKAIRRTINRGHGAQIVISHDICHTVQLSEHGGHGYTHIHRTVLPLMLQRGFSQAKINQIMVDNPRRLLTFI